MIGKKLQFIPKNTVMTPPFIDTEQVFGKTEIAIGDLRLEYVVSPPPVETWRSQEPNYHILFYKKDLIGSSTKDRMMQMYNGIRYAFGEVLLLGAGVGMELVPLAERRCVKKIYVLDDTEGIEDFLAPFWADWVDSECWKKIEWIKSDDSIPKGMIDWLLMRDFKSHEGYREYCKVGDASFAFYDNTVWKSDMHVDYVYWGGNQ
jgi:hypothetical protein